MRFANKVAAVTGATSGIGHEVATRLLWEGASVVAVGRNREALERLGSGATPDRFASWTGDVTADEAPAAIVEVASTRFGGLDVLVNAAGIIGSGTVETTTDEAWDQMFDVNLRAPFRLIRAAVPLLAARQGAIVNVSSVTGLRSFPGVLSYCVSKAGVDHLTRCAALELAPKRVRINAVNPGVVVTNLHRRSGMGEEQYAAFLERSRETHPLGRPGQPSDVAGLILFLASDAASWITGETIAVDGGRHLTCAR